MDVLKIIILFAAVFAMDTIGMLQIHKDSIGRNRKMFYLVSLSVGAALAIVLVKVYPDENIFIQKMRMAFLYGILCPIAFSDFHTKKIPNCLLIVSACVWGGTAVLECVKNTDSVYGHVRSSFTAAVMVFVVCTICKALIKNSIGMGDIKLFMVMGLFQGVEGMSSAVFTSLVVAFFGALILLLTKRKKRKDNICFGPFILAGTTLSMFLTGV